MMYTPRLISAVLANDINTITSLLNTDININQSYNSLTALQYAIKIRRIKIVKLLIQNGADLSICNSKTYESSLEYIFKKFNQKSTLSILKIMPNLCIVDGYDKCTALHYAARYNYCDCIDYLIQHWIDVNCTNSQGQTPMIFAAISGSHESIELLASHGADVNLQDKAYDKHWTPIFYAVLNSDIRCIDS